MNNTRFKNACELFPQLANKKDENRFLNFIKVDDLRIFARECIKKANHKITEYDNKVAEISMDLLIRKDLLSPDNHQTYVDALLIASLLHNIYFDEKNLCTSLFKAREEFDSVADMEELYEFGAIPEQFREMVWDTIEGQLGDCTPMSKTRPSPNSPQDLFATAVYITRNAPFWFFDK